jgi:ketosteroid isomerase-like protein
MGANLDVKVGINAFVDQWISDWNRKDVEAVLAHFSETVVFTSARAKAVLGSPRLEGKSRLREYWSAAIGQIQTIRFALDYVISEGNRMGIVYNAEIDGRRTRAVEFLTFGENGLVREGEAMYGIEL